MRRPNLLKHRLAQGEAVLGTWMVIPSPDVANIVAAAGFDFMIIDMQRGPQSFQSALNIARAIEAEGSTALIRVPSDDVYQMSRALETGVGGLMVAELDSADQTREAVEAVNQYSRLCQGNAVYTRSTGYQGTAAEAQNSETFTGLLLEQSIDAGLPEAILDIAELDMIYIDIFRLCRSLSLPPNASHPRVLNMLKSFASRIRSRDVAAGILAQTPEDVTLLREAGFNFIAYQADSGILLNACRQVTKCIRSARAEMFCG